MNYNLLSKEKLFTMASLLVFFTLTTFASGYATNPWSSGRDIVISSLGNPLFLLCVAFFFPRIASGLLLCHLVVISLYFPIGWLYGAPTFGIIGVALETDKQESMEFLSSLPASLYVLQIAFFIGGLLVWNYSKKLFIEAKKWHQKVKNYLALTFIILLLVPPMGNYITGGKIQDDETFVPVSIIGFYLDALLSPKIYWEKKQELMQQISRPPTWHIQSVTPKYKNYIIVIGESARSDYMGAYGFSLPNTPFMSEVNGLLIDGYISASHMTMRSIPTTISMQGLAHNNLISLAKKSGFSTYWLSNQGMSGVFASTVSKFAMVADFNYFTQRGDYEKSLMSDSLLLPVFKKVLNQDSISSRLIVLHLMGSHANFCKRLTEKGEFVFLNKNLSCYVNTIKQTDDLLADIIAILRAKKETYSMIYFSDHGLKHVGKGKQRTLTHGSDRFESYSVPFAKISSDDTRHRVIKTQRSAFNFLKGFSQWTGIKTREIVLDDYDFFGEKPDIPDATNNLSKVNALPRDRIDVAK